MNCRATQLNATRFNSTMGKQKRHRQIDMKLSEMLALHYDKIFANVLRHRVGEVRVLSSAIFGNDSQSSDLERTQAT